MTADSAPVTVSNVGFTLVAIATTIALLRYMSEVFIPFVLAGLLFYALDPIVDRLQRLKVPRAIGAALTMLLLLASAGALSYSLFDDVDRVAASVPDATQRLRRTLRALREGGPGALDRIQEAVTAIAETAKEAAGEPAKPAGSVKVQVAAREPNLLLTGSPQVFAFAGQVIMVVFLAYFLPLADELFKRKLVENFGPTLAHKKVTVQILNDIASQIEQFIMVQLFTSVVVGIVTGWRCGGLASNSRGYGGSQPASSIRCPISDRSSSPWGCHSWALSNSVRLRWRSLLPASRCSSQRSRGGS